MLILPRLQLDWQSVTAARWRRSTAYQPPLIGGADCNVIALLGTCNNLFVLVTSAVQRRVPSDFHLRQWFFKLFTTRQSWFSSKTPLLVSNFSTHRVYFYRFFNLFKFITNWMINFLSLWFSQVNEAICLDSQSRVTILLLVSNFCKIFLKNSSDLMINFSLIWYFTD